MDTTQQYRAYTPSCAAWYLFHHPHAAWFWLFVRLYLGYGWFMAGWEKVTSPAWIGEASGTALSGFIQGALAKTGGPYPDVYGWYATFLEGVVQPRAVIWSYAVAYGEVLVGLGLIVGAFTGIAAFFGFFMNWNFLMSGSVSVNPVYLLLALGIILAWRIAGNIGLDRYLLPKCMAWSERWRHRPSGATDAGSPTAHQ